MECLPRYLVYGHPLRHTSTNTPPDPHNTSSSIVLSTDNPGVQTTYPTTPSNPSQPQTTHPDNTHPSGSEHTDLPTSTPRNTDSPNPQNSDRPDTQSPPTDNAAVSDSASTEGQPGLTPESSLAEEGQEVINLTDVGHDPDMKGTFPERYVNKC